MICAVCEGMGCSRCLPDLLEPHPAYLRFLEARAEVMASTGDPEVAAIYCAACGDSPKLGAVRRHARWGLYFDALLPSAIERTDEIRERERELKRQSGRRMTAAVGRSVVLLDFPDEMPAYRNIGGQETQDAPAAECHRHGRDTIDRASLVALARSAKRRKALTIHNQPPSTG